MFKSLDPSQQYFIVSVICTGFGYLVYWILGNSDAFIHMFTKRGKGSIQEVVLRRMFGFVMMGIVPAMLVWYSTFKTPGQMGLNFEWNMNFLYWFAGLGIPSVILTRIANKKPANWEVYPQIRIPVWSSRTFFTEFITWALYLAGYEFLFRGVLFFASLEIMSAPAAVALNVLIYAFAHLPKGTQETIGSLILGTLLCIAVIKTGSIWIAFAVHVVMAWSNSTFSFIENPYFSYARK